jgi:predicted ArsR family transcriptional regulator
MQDPASRDRVLQLLRPGPGTVNDLAAALRLTDNAVRAHLANLQADGLVEAAGQRPGARKPHQLFALTPAGRERFPTADRPLLGGLLAGLEQAMSPAALLTFLERVGANLAGPRQAELARAPRSERLAAALDVLAALGGAAELCEEDGRTVIRGRHCPLAALVPAHPEVCAVAQGLVAALVGEPVRERCEKGPRPCCRFELSAA